MGGGKMTPQSANPATAGYRTPEKPSETGCPPVTGVTFPLFHGRSGGLRKQSGPANYRGQVSQDRI